MATYSVMVPREGGSRALADVVLVRAGFNLPAALLGPVWLAYRRNWRALAVWAAYGSTALGLFATGYLRPEALGWTLEAAALFIGMQAQPLTEAALQRRRYRLDDVVSGDNAREAERIYFRRALARTHLSPAPPARASAPHTADGVIGLFPIAEAR